MATSTPITPSVYRAISPRRRRINKPISARKAKAPHAAKASPAMPSKVVQIVPSTTTVRMPTAAPSSAIPASNISRWRKDASMSAAPLQIAGVECERDGTHDEIEHYRFGAHQAANEIREMLGEGQIAEQAAQRVGILEALQVADEPERQQHQYAAQRRDDLVLRQGGKELADRQARHAEQ